MHGLLSLLIWLPIAAGVLVLLLGDRNIAAGRWLALAALARDARARRCRCGPHFDTSTADLQFTELLPWIPRFDAYYALGVDGISLPLIVLTAFMTVPVVIAGWTVIESAPGAVLRRLPHHGRPDDRGVLGDRCAAVLLLLGSDADPDVPHHRHLGRPAARVRHHQVLPVHLPRLGVHAGGAHLHVREGAATTRSRACRRCR